MSKLIRLSPTGIEYGDYAWNFASGCGNNIDGNCKSGGFRCWAYSITQRFEGHYPNGFKPTIYSEALLSPLYLKKPSRILCAFMGDLFWDCPEFDPDRQIEGMLPSGVASIGMSLKGWLYTTIRRCPHHTFLFLTKQPQNLPKWEFPNNCWVGVTATSKRMFYDATWELQDVKATIKYLSIEPLLNWERTEKEPKDIISHLSDWLRRASINWLIIGALTSKKHSDLVPLHSSTGLDIEKWNGIWTLQPKIEWVEEIVTACDKAGIPVFLKDNLKPLIDETPMCNWAYDKKALGWFIRQEIPC